MRPEIEVACSEAEVVRSILAMVRGLKPEHNAEALDFILAARVGLRAIGLHLDLEADRVRAELRAGAGL